MKNIERKTGVGKCAVFVLIVMATTFGRAGAASVTVATGEWAPFVSEHLENKGFLTEIVTEVFAEMGVRVEYVFYPWRRCYESVLNGKVWAAFPYSYTEERSREVMFSDKISHSITRFFAYNYEGRQTWENLDDFQECRLGGVLGYFYEETFKDAGLKLDYAPKEINALEKLHSGRIELLPLNELVGWFIIKKAFPRNSKNFSTLEKPFSQDDLHMIVSKSYPDSASLLDRFNAALKIVKDNYIYNGILERYMK